MWRRLPARSPRAQRGSVFVEFWIFFLLWLALAGVSMQVCLTLNRQICVNYMSFLAARGYMGQPNDNKAKDWVDYETNFYANFQIENRLFNHYKTTFKKQSNVKGGGDAIVAEDKYPQKWAGLIRMAFPLAGHSNYPTSITLNSWGYIARCSDDEEAQSDDHDNDCDDYSGYQGNVSMINNLVSTFNQIQGLF